MVLGDQNQIFIIKRGKNDKEKEEELDYFIRKRNNIALATDQMPPSVELPCIYNASPLLFSYPTTLMMVLT